MSAISNSLLGLKWAMRDIRGAWSSFILVILCLVIGLASIATVHIAAGSVLGSIQKNGRTILGADWIVQQIYNPVDQAEKAWLRARGATLSETIELRPMLINPATGDSTLVELKVVDDVYPLYGEFTVLSGESFARKKEEGGILEPSLKERLGLEDSSTVQLGQYVMPVSDWIDQEPDRAGSRRFGLAPRVVLSKALFDKTGLEAPGGLISYDLRVQWPEAAEPSPDDFKAAFPNSTWRLTTHDNASPQIQRFVNNTLQFLSLVGLSSLLIGGIGIANGLRAYFTSRMTSIAIYKMVGTPQSVLRWIYGWQIAIITLIGVGIGICVGALLPWLGLNIARDMLPFPVDVRYSLSTLGVPAIFGILTMWLFALWPFGRAEKTSPLILFRHGATESNLKPAVDLLLAMLVIAILLAAFIFLTATDQRLATSFLTGAFLCFLIFAGLGKAIAAIAAKRSSGATLSSRLAMTNLGGPRNATILTLVSIGIGLTVLSGVTLIDRNMRGIFAENMPEDAPAFFFLDVQPDQKDAFAETVKSFPNAYNLVMTPNLRGRIKAVNGVPAAEALRDDRERWLLQNDRGFTYMSTQPKHSEIIAGEWWPADYNGPPLVSVVDDVQRAFGVKPGDTITVTILGRDITATIANVREVNWTSFTINFAITFSPGVLEAAPHNWLGTVAAPLESEAALQRTVSKAFPNISMVRVSDAIKSIEDLMGQMVIAIRVMATLTLLTGILVLSGALMATRTERSYDAVILKVVGTPQSMLLGSLCLEFALLGFVAAVLAGVFGLVISWGVMGPLMDLGWTFYPATVSVIVVTGFLIIFATGVMTLRSVLSKPVRQYLNDD